MTKVDDFIKSLSHEAAPRIYDPVKAHEYYMRTRKLKGRRSASALKSKQAKEGWSYVQNQVSQNRKAETKQLAEKRKADLQKLRDDVAQKRKELSEKLKNILAAQKVPKGSSKEARANAAATSKAEREKAKAERAKLSEDLKNTIAQAKYLYGVAAEGIKAKYESALDTEYNALKSMKRR